MIDCSKTENYLKQRARMAETVNGCCNIHCADCPLSINNNGTGCTCLIFENVYPDRAVAVVQKWSDEHPKKTYKDDFFEKFPNAPTEADGTPKCCLEDIYRAVASCSICSKAECKKCWNEVMPE